MSHAASAAAKTRLARTPLAIASPRSPSPCRDTSGCANSGTALRSIRRGVVAEGNDFDASALEGRVGPQIEREAQGDQRASCGESRPRSAAAAKVSAIPGACRRGWRRTSAAAASRRAGSIDSIAPSESFRPRAASSAAVHFSASPSHRRDARSRLFVAPIAAAGRRGHDRPGEVWETDMSAEASKKPRQLRARARAAPSRSAARLRATSRFGAPPSFRRLARAVRLGPRRGARNLFRRDLVRADRAGAAQSRRDAASGASSARQALDRLPGWRSSATIRSAGGR